MTARSTVEATIRLLIAQLGGKLEHGARVVAGRGVDGFDVEISIAITRHVERDETRFYHDEALDLLLRDAYHTCQHSKANRHGFGSRTTGCGNQIAAAIVYRRTPYLPWGHEGPIPRSYGYDFVCPSHRDHPRYAAPDMIAVVRFSESERTAIRRAFTKRREQWYAKQRQEEKERGE